MSSAEQTQKNGSNTVDDTANSAVEPDEKKPNLRSDIWPYFTLKTDKDKKKWAYCNKCNKRLTYISKNGTNGLRGHYNICQRNGQTKIDDFQSRLTGKRSKTDESGGSILATHRFSYDESRGDLATMITAHGYPLSMVEHEFFRVFCQGLQPLFKPICRNTARSDIISLYEEEKAKIMKLVESNQGRIAITTDMWTSNNQKKGYMTVTSHFIDDSWILQCRLLRYLEESTLPGSHGFDVLAWWKLNGIKYPTLCVIAKDILAIPISTVASESSFSTSGRIIGPHRSKLLPKTIEAIICTQNWKWGGKGGCVIDGGDDVHVDEEDESNEGYSNVKE